MMFMMVAVCVLAMQTSMFSDKICIKEMTYTTPSPMVVAYTASK